MHQSVFEAAPEGAKVISTVQNEAMGKGETQLNLWVCEMMINTKNGVDSTVVTLIAKEKLQSCYQGQKHVKPSTTSDG